MTILTWSELNALQIATNNDALDAAIADHADTILAYRVMSLETKRSRITGNPIPGETEWIEWGNRTFYNRAVAIEQWMYDRAHGKTVKIEETEVHIHYPA